MIPADTITLYDAITAMRELSKRGIFFSFVHACYNDDKKTSSGITYVTKAILRPTAKDDAVKNAKFKLFYQDIEINEPRNCWQPLIMFFNEQKVILQ